MKKEQIKNILDYIPLAILTVSAILLLLTVATTDIMLVWKHYLGLFILPLHFFAFWKNHKIGVIFLALTIIIGMLGLISFSPAIGISTWYITISGRDVIFFYGQSIFLLWLSFN